MIPHIFPKRKERHLNSIYNEQPLLIKALVYYGFIFRARSKMINASSILSFPKFLRETPYIKLKNVPLFDNASISLGLILRA